MECSPLGSSVHGDSPGKSTGVGCQSLQGIFPTQRSNPGLLHCRQILYLQPPGKPSGDAVWLPNFCGFFIDNFVCLTIIFFLSQKLHPMFSLKTKTKNSLATLLFFIQSLNVSYLGSLTGAYPLLILPFSFSDAQIWSYFLINLRMKFLAHFTVTLKTFPKVVLAISSVASLTTLSCSLPSSHEVTQYYIIIVLSYSFVFSLLWLAFPCFASLTSCCKTTFTVVSSLLSCIFPLHNVSVLCIATI